jgi:hypothetical protein
MTPSLFPDEPADLAALADIAARSIPRARLQAEGFRGVTKSTELQPEGYTVIDWLHPARALAGAPDRHVMEYVPSSHRRPRGAPTLPRLTASTYAEQVAIHQALGLRVVSPGQPFTRTRSATRG